MSRTSQIQLTWMAVGVEPKIDGAVRTNNGKNISCIPQEVREKMFFCQLVDLTFQFHMDKENTELVWWPSCHITLLRDSYITYISMHLMHLEYFFVCCWMCCLLFSFFKEKKKNPHCSWESKLFVPKPVVQRLKKIPYWKLSSVNQ